MQTYIVTIHEKHDRAHLYCSRSLRCQKLHARQRAASSALSYAAACVMLCAHARAHSNAHMSLTLHSRWRRWLCVRMIYVCCKKPTHPALERSPRAYFRAFQTREPTGERRKVCVERLIHTSRLAIPPPPQTVGGGSYIIASGAAWRPLSPSSSSLPSSYIINSKLSRSNEPPSSFIFIFGARVCGFSYGSCWADCCSGRLWGKGISSGGGRSIIETLGS